MFLRSSPESKSLAEIYFSLAHTISKLWSSFWACLFGLWLAGCPGKAAVQVKLLCSESYYFEFHCLAIWLAV
jgi:hypothetical protein